MKQVKSIVWALLVVFLVACTQAVEVPEGTIPEEKMGQIMTDIHLVEARVSRLSMASVDSTTLVSERLKKDVFKKYKIDTAAYNQSYRFYSTHPEYLERIYEKVVKDFEKRVKKDDVKGL